MDEGERDAFLKEVGPQRSRMVRVIWRLLRNADDVEDALQEALLIAWRKLEQVANHPRPDLLLARITLNAALDRLQKRNRCWSHEQPGESAAEVADTRASPREASELEEQRQRLLEQVALLPRQQSLAVLLHLVEERSFAEVADVLECDTATARSHVSKGVARLRERLRDWVFG